MDNQHLVMCRGPCSAQRQARELICGPYLATRARLLSFNSTQGDRDSTVIKVLRYKSEGRWFDSSWCHWNFSLTYSFRSHYGPGVDSASNRNVYQEHFLGVKAAGA